MYIKLFICLMDACSCWTRRARGPPPFPLILGPTQAFSTSTRRHAGIVILAYIKTYFFYPREVREVREETRMRLPVEVKDVNSSLLDNSIYFRQ